MYWHCTLNCGVTVCIKLCTGNIHQIVCWQYTDTTIIFRNDANRSPSSTASHASRLKSLNNLLLLPRIQRRFLVVQPLAQSLYRQSYRGPWTTFLPPRLKTEDPSRLSSSYCSGDVTISTIALRPWPNSEGRHPQCRQPEAGATATK